MCPIFVVWIFFSSFARILSSFKLPEVFCKKRVLKNFADFFVKTPVLESLFTKVADLKACTFIKRGTPTQTFSCKICKIFKITYFKEHPRTIASVLPFILYLRSNKVYNISHKLLRPIQFLEKFMEILEWSTLQK